MMFSLYYVDKNGTEVYAYKFEDFKAKMAWIRHWKSKGVFSGFKIIRVSDGVVIAQSKAVAS